MAEKISLDEIKRKLEGEWIAFLVTGKTSKGQLIGKLIAHNKDRRMLHSELRRRRVKNVYVTYAGPIVKPGYTVIF